MNTAALVKEIGKFGNLNSVLEDNIARLRGESPTVSAPAPIVVQSPTPETQIKAAQDDLARKAAAVETKERIAAQKEAQAERLGDRTLEPKEWDRLLDGAAALRKLLTGGGQYLFRCRDGSARRRQRQKQRETTHCAGSGQPSRWATDGKTPCKDLQRVDGTLRTVFGADAGIRPRRCGGLPVARLGD